MINEYIRQFAKKLKKNGVAFIHHSNLGAYWYYQKFTQRTIKFLRRLKFIEEDHWRAYSVSAEKVRHMCGEVGLRCIVQEIVPWYTKKTFLDCYSIIVNSNSEWIQKTKIFHNKKFEFYKKYTGRLARYYDPKVKTYAAVAITYDTLNNDNP